MLRGIIFKEFKEKRGIIFLGLAICIMPIFIAALIRAGGLGGASLARNLPLTLSLFFYCALAILFPALCAASSLSGEVEKKTLASLLTLPLSRGKIWTAKFLASLMLTYILCGLFSIINIEAIKSLIIELSSREIYFSGLLALFFLPLASLSISLFISSFMNSPLISATASAGVTSAVAVFSYPIFDIIGWGTYPDQIAVAGISISLIFSTTSYYIFKNGEMMKSGFSLAKKATIGFAIALLIGLIPIGAHTLYRAFIFQGRINKFIPIAVYNNGSTVLAEAAIDMYGCYTPYWYDSRLCIIPVDGSPVKIIPIPKQNFFEVKISPDDKKALLLCEKSTSWLTHLEQNRDIGELYLIDLNTLKTKKIAQYPKLEHYDKLFWLDNEHFSALVANDLLTYDVTGRLLSSKTMPINSMIEQGDGVLFICTSYLYHKVNDQLMERKIKAEMYEPISGKSQTILDRICRSRDGFGESLIGFPENPICNNGKDCIYIKEALPGEITVCCEDITSGGKAKIREVKLKKELYPTYGESRYKVMFSGETLNLYVILCNSDEKTGFLFFNSDNGNMLSTTKIAWLFPRYGIFENKENKEVAFVEMTDKKVEGYPQRKECILYFAKINTEGNIEKKEIAKFKNYTSVSGWHDKDSVIVAEDVHKLSLIKRDGTIKEIYNVNIPRGQE